MTAHGTDFKNEYIFPFGWRHTELIKQYDAVKGGNWTIKTTRWCANYCDFAFAKLKASKINMDYNLVFHNDTHNVNIKSLTLLDSSVPLNDGVDASVVEQVTFNKSVFDGNVISPDDYDSELVTLPEAWVTYVKTCLNKANIEYQKDVSFALFSVAQEISKELDGFNQTGTPAHTEDETKL